jgi:hypothetical protein
MMGTKLSHISRKACKDKKLKFTNLMHLVNGGNLCDCYRRLKTGKAAGVDRVTVEEYGECLKANVEDLVQRMKRMSYRPQYGSVREGASSKGVLSLYSTRAYLHIGSGCNAVIPIPGTSFLMFAAPLTTRVL